MGHNSVKKIVVELQFSAYCLIMLYILYQVSQKYLKGFLSYKVDMTFILKFLKGHYSVKMKMELWFLFTAHRLMML